MGPATIGTVTIGSVLVLSIHFNNLDWFRLVQCRMQPTDSIVTYL